MQIPPPAPGRDPARMLQHTRAQLRGHGELWVFGYASLIWRQEFDAVEHRSALVREYLEALNGAIQIEQLPGYAPELNPTEYIWGHLKHHELANHCAGNFADLKTSARNRLRSMQRRPTLIRAFWQQAELAW